MTSNYYLESIMKHITDLFETNILTSNDVLEAIENTELVERIHNKMRSMIPCEHKFVQWFLPRVWDCNCGKCSSCIQSGTYFDTIESHLNMFEVCTCKVCMHYWSVCDKYNWKPFQYTEDERIVQMRKDNKHISANFAEESHVKRRRIDYDSAAAVPVACELASKPVRNPAMESIIFDRIAKLCETDTFYSFKLFDILYRVQIVKKLRVYAQKMKRQHGNVKWYPIYFLRRTNNCECTCGVNACCLSGNEFFGTVQNHFDIDMCSCPICMCYQESMFRSREDGQYFRLTQDEFLKE
jgi:hypothetical protein